MVSKEAEEQHKLTNHHFAHMLVHGFLHLCGYDHCDEVKAKEMEALEVRILGCLGVSDPYAGNNDE